MPIIQAVERALTILDLFDEHSTELKITEISERMNLNKSTVHSLLKTLKKSGYIDQDGESGKYKLGMKLLERGNFVITNLDVRNIAKKYLLDLSKKTGHTLHLVILEGKEGLYIDKVEGTSANVLYSRIGRRVPIHTSGVGKLLVALSSQEEIDKMMDGYIFDQRTPRTITNKTDFLNELAEIKINGFAYDREENEPGICCLAFPIRNHTGNAIAAFSVSMPTPRLNDEEMERIIPLMLQTGEEISQKMGYVSRTPYY